MKVKTDSEAQFTVTITGNRLEMQALLDLVQNPQLADEPPLYTAVRVVVYGAIQKELNLDKELAQHGL